MKKIITIQHTESIHHTNGMVGSWTDWDLSDLGIDQAERIGIELSKEIGNEEYIMYTSDLLRARHTAEIIGRHLGTTPIIRQELRERNLGKAVGKSIDWLKKNIECEELTVEDKLFSDGESRKDVWERVLPFFNELMEKEDKNIILVSHGDSLSIFNAIWLGLDPDMLNKMDLCGRAGGVSFMREIDKGKRIITGLSDMSYVK